MTVEGGAPPRVLQGVRRILKEKPSGATVRELAWGLDVPIVNMHQYVKRLHQLGLLESAGFTTDLRGRGHRTRLWRWAG